MIAALVERGVVVAAGHTDATSAEMEAAVAAGVTMVTHLYNAMRPFGHRDPGPVGATLAGAVPVAGLIADGDPRRIPWPWPPPGGPSGPAGSPSSPTPSATLGPGRVAATPCACRDGTLAGSTLTMDAAVRNLRSFTGCSLSDAVDAATATPAAVLRDDTRGELVAGRRGDLVVLSPGGEVLATVIGGEVAWRMSAHDARRSR